MPAATAASKRSATPASRAAASSSGPCAREQRLVRRDDGLAGGERPSDRVRGRVGAAHELDDDVHVVRAGQRVHVRRDTHAVRAGRPPRARASSRTATPTQRRDRVTALLRGRAPLRIEELAGHGRADGPQPEERDALARPRRRCRRDGRLLGRRIPRRRIRGGRFLDVLDGIHPPCSDRSAATAC